MPEVSAVDPLGRHLVALAANSDPAAVDAAVRAVLTFARPLLHRYTSRWPRYIEQADAEQITCAQAIQAARNYDPTRPAGPFLATVIRYNLLSELKGCRLDKRRANYDAIRLDQQDDSDDPLSLADLIPDHRHPAPDHTADHRHRAKLADASLRAILSPHEYDCYTGADVEGRTYAEIAQTLRVDVKSIDNSLSRARTKIRQAVARGEAAFLKIGQETPRRKPTRRSPKRRNPRRQSKS